MLQSEGRCYFSRRIRTQIRRKRKNSCGTGRASSKVLRRMRDVGRPKKKAEGAMGKSKEKNLLIYVHHFNKTSPKILAFPLLLTTSVYSPEKKRLIGNDTFGDSLDGLKAS